MTTSPSATSATVRGKRPRNTVPLAPQASKEAKRLAAVILEVLAGVRQPSQAAEALQVSLPRYYQVETRALQGLLAACESRPKGRQPEMANELATLQQHNARLQREVARQQALVRVGQRVVGVPAAMSPAPKAAGKKKRQRKARALTMAARLRQEAAEADQPSDNGMSASSS
jgi:hypothetical protein